MCCVSFLIPKKLLGGMKDGITANSGINCLAILMDACLLSSIPCARKISGLFLLEKQTSARGGFMSIRRVKVNPAKPASLPEGRFDSKVFDQTTEADLLRQQHED